MSKEPSPERKITGGVAVRVFGLLGLVAAMAIIVLVPVVVDPNKILFAATEAYHPLKFKVLMWCSAALLVAVLGVVVLRRRKPFGVPVLIPALAFLGVSALSTLLSESPSYSLLGDRYNGLLSLAAGVLLFYALARVLNSPLRVRIFLAAGVSAAVLVSIFGISQNYGLDMISGWGAPWSLDLIGRPFSTIGNPVTLASYLTLMIGAAAALCFKAGSSSSSSWAGRAPWLIALAVIGACWLYTDTRAAMLAAGATLPVVLWFGLHRMGTVRPLLVPLVAVLAGMAAAIVAAAVLGNLSLSGPTMAIIVAYLALIGAVIWLSRRWTKAARFLLVSLGVLATAAIVAIIASAALGNLSLPDDRAAAADSRAVADRGGESLQVRLYIWRNAIPIILERPLLGHGPDNFFAPFEAQTGEDPEAVNGVENTDKAHNDFLQIAATTGLLGLAAYLWVLVAYFRNVYRRGGWPLIALSGGVLAYLIQLQASFPSIDTDVAFWGVLGASVAVMRLQDRGSEEEPERAETESVEAALSAETPRKNIYELLVVVIVVGSLVAVAVPTFLGQRAKAAEIDRLEVALNVRQTASVYEQARAQSGTYPDDEVYTENEPISPGSYLPRGITITTTTTPAGGLTVEGESNTLSGTFRGSYDSTTGQYTYDSAAGESTIPFSLPVEAPS